jgi:hypothetical protein
VHRATHSRFSLVLHVSLHTLLGPSIQQAQQHVNIQHKGPRSGFNKCQPISHRLNPEHLQTLFLLKHCNGAQLHGKAGYRYPSMLIPLISFHTTCIFHFLLACSPTAPDHSGMAAARRSRYCASALGKQSGAKFLEAGGELRLQTVTTHPALLTTLLW